MSVETASFPAQLNTAWPLASDFISEGDDHIRLAKTVLKTTFPNVSGAVNASHTEVNYLVGVTSSVQAQIDGKGAIAGQTWTGPHVFPSTTTIGSLTPTKLGYLATITSDVQAQINAKGATTGQTWSGSHDFTLANVQVPTRASNDNSNAAASTAFVVSAALSSALPGQTGNAGKYITTDGVTASWATPLVPPNPVLTGLIESNGSVRGTRVALVGTAVDCSLSNYFAATVSGGTTFSFTNAPASGTRYAMVLEVTHTSGAITWPASVVWPNNLQPPLTAGRVHLFYFLTVNGGATWRASALPNYLT